MVVMGQCCEQPHGATTADDNPASARNFRRVEVGEVGRFAHTAGDLELKQGCPCDGSGSELNHDALLGSLGECRALPAGLDNGGLAIETANPVGVVTVFRDDLVSLVNPADTLGKIPRFRFTPEKPLNQMRLRSLETDLRPISGFNPGYGQLLSY
jgi:hypothetical protein